MRRAIHISPAGWTDAISTATNAFVSGGRGIDTLQVYGANNTIAYGVGDGTDRVRTNGAERPQAFRKRGGGSDADVGSGTGVGGQVGGNLTDKMTFEQFDAGNVLSLKPFERIEWDDGSALLYDELVGRGFDLAGSAGNDQIVVELAPISRISGGAGDDTLSGGDGDDWYSLVLGDGRDQVIDTAGADTLAFGVGLNLADMSVDQHVEAGRRWLDLAFAGGDRVSIRDGYLGDGTLRVRRRRHADGY